MVKLGGAGWPQYGLKDFNHQRVGLLGQHNRRAVQNTTALVGALCGKECACHNNQLTNGRSQSTAVVAIARRARYVHDTERKEW